MPIHQLPGGINRFIHARILENCLRAAIGHNPTYNQAALGAMSRADRLKAQREFRNSVYKEMTLLGRRYRVWNYNLGDYTDDLCEIADRISSAHNPILIGGRLRLGFVQKACTLYLKYLWLLGHPEKEPVVAVLDGIVLNQLGETTKKEYKPWTQLDDPQEYMEIQDDIRKDIPARCKSKNATPAEWELERWGDIIDKDEMDEDGN